MRLSLILMLVLVCVLSACRREQASDTIPVESTNELVVSLRQTYERVVPSNRTNTLKSLLLDLELQFSKYDLRSKSAEDLEKLAQELRERQDFSNAFQIDFYNSLKNLARKDSNALLSIPR